MASRRGMLVGGGRPAMRGEPPIRDQLDGYLKRLRHTVPFPITSEEAYFGCMPPVIRRMYDEQMFDPLPGKPGKVFNLTLCLTTAVNTMHGGESPNIVHVATATSTNQEVDMLDETFWFVAPKGVPAPVYRLGTAFQLPDDHPHRKAILKWVDDALKIEQGIQRAHAAIAKFEQMAKSGAHVATGWPELLSFVKYRRIMPPLPSGAARQLHEQVDREIRPVEKLNTIELLTTCILLPEVNPELKAWVNFYVEGL